MEGWVGPSTTSVNNLIIDSRPGGARTQSLTRDLTLRHAEEEEEEEQQQQQDVFEDLKALKYHRLRGVMIELFN